MSESAHPGPDRLLALALADVEPLERRSVESHLAGCPACREEFAELSGGVVCALAATPSIAAPDDFSARVLAALFPDAPASSLGPSVLPSSAPARRPSLRLWLAVAAGAGLLAGVLGTLAAGSFLPRPAESPPPVTTALPSSGVTVPASVAIPLVNAAGDAVGSAGLATLDSRAFLLLNITQGRPGVAYECVLVGRDGRRTSGGTWTLGGYSGSTQASGSWLVPIAGDAPAAVELVTPAGKVWSRATF